MPDKPPSLRERQAQLTRDEILKAARRLFAERGYTRTSVRDIAEAAGVSAQTVYDSIGSKQALVARLNDLIDVEAGIGGHRAGRGPLERSGEVAATVGQGHPVDPRALRRHHPRPGHRGGGRARSRRSPSPRASAATSRAPASSSSGSAGLDALDPSVDADAAVDTLAAISDVRFALLLRDELRLVARPHRIVDRHHQPGAAARPGLSLIWIRRGLNLCKDFRRVQRWVDSRHNVLAWILVRRRS